MQVCSHVPWGVFNTASDDTLRFLVLCKPNASWPENSNQQLAVEFARRKDVIGATLLLERLLPASHRTPLADLFSLTYTDNDSRFEVMLPGLSRLPALLLLAIVLEYPGVSQLHNDSPWTEMAYTSLSGFAYNWSTQTKVRVLETALSTQDSPDTRRLWSAANWSAFFSLWWSTPEGAEVAMVTDAVNAN